MLRAVAIVCLLLAAWSNGAFAADTLTPPPEDLAAFLFASQLGAVPLEGVICPSIQRATVSESLYRRLAATDNRYVPFKQCARVLDVRKGSFHRPSGRPAYFVDIQDFSLSAAGTALVKTDVYHHGKWAIYKTLEVARVDGEWRVVRTVDHWEA